MELVAERMAEIADYCRVDADDAQLPSLVAVAETYLAGAGIAVPETGTARAELYLQCVKWLTLDLYDRRDASVEGSIAENPGFRRILNQLKMTEVVPGSGTTSEEGS